MKTPTIKSFTAQSNIPAPLIRAVINQLGGFDSFKESAPDIANHGIDGGFGGFIYHCDTVPFTKKHKQHIIDLAEAQAAECDYGDLYTMINGFNCLKGMDFTPARIAALIHGREPRDDDGQADYTTLYNALAWYAGEEVSRAWCDYLEYLND